MTNTSFCHTFLQSLKRLIRSKDFYFCLLFTIINLGITVRLFHTHHLTHPFIFILVSLIVEFIIFTVYYILRKKQKSPEHLFLLFVLPLGLLFNFLLPIGEVPDEWAHILRAYGVSEGTIIAESPASTPDHNSGSLLPANILEYTQELPASGTYSRILQQLGAPASPERVRVVYTNSAGYNAIYYLPQAFGLNLGKIFHLSMLGQLYLGRCFNLLAFIILAFFAIKFLPRFKSFAIFIALLPITLQQAASFSPDALTIGFSMLLVAYTLHLTYSAVTRLRRADYVILYGLALVIGLCKITCLPLILLYFLIPDSRFGGKKSKILHASILAILVILVNLGQLALSSRYFVGIDGVDSTAQLGFLLSHPLQYLATIIHTLGSHTQFYLMGTLGTSLGAFQINLPDFYFYFSIGFVTLLLAQNAERLSVQLWQRLIMITSIIIPVILTFTALYLQWTEVGATTIEGVQGRYFIPFLILLPFIFASNRHQEHHATLVSTPYVLYYGFFINACALTCIFCQNA